MPGANEVWFWPGSVRGKNRGTLVWFDAGEDHERLQSALLYKLQQEGLVIELEDEIERLGSPAFKMKLDLGPPGLKHEPCDLLVRKIAEHDAITMCPYCEAHFDVHAGMVFLEGKNNSAPSSDTHKEFERVMRMP